MRATLRAAIVVSAIALAGIPASIVAARNAPRVDPHLQAAQAALEQMTPLERAGQVIMTSVPGTTLKPRDRTRIRRLQPGGVILFATNYRADAQLRRFTRQLQRATPGLLISIDQEGGIVKRIAAIPPTRSHPQLGSRNRVARTRAQGSATGRALRARGVNMNLAPVADLDLGPRHVMKSRSFGRQPARVSRHVAAFVTGLQREGVAASVKHFPGFGGASVNSDDAIAVVQRSRAALRKQDLAPFRAAIAAGTDSVMMSHGIYPAVDRQHPASASPAAYQMLRETLGYDGVAITDALHASGFTAATRSSVAAGCVTVIAAGADIALLTGSVADAVRCRARINAAVRTGAIPAERLDAAALRVLMLKSRRGLLEPTS